MSITYTPTTNFGAKDALPANDPAKVIKGAEFTTEYTAIQSAFLLAAPASNPTFTGTATFADIAVSGTVDGRDVAADGTKLDGVEASANNYALPQATSTVRGGVELGSDTVQAVAANAVSSTAGKTYAVQLNSDDQMVVNVPWVDTISAGTVTSVSGSNGISGTVTSSGSLSLDNDLRGHAWQIGRDTDDYITVDTTAIDFYLDGTLDMRLSNSGQLDVDGNVIAYSTTTSSDAKLKNDVTTLDNALVTVERLRGVRFTWNEQTRLDGKRDIGVIAQEVQAVLPELVLEVDTMNKEGETHLTVDYPKLTAVLIEAVKELSAEVKTLKESS